MRKTEIQQFKIYAAKVSGNIVPVQIQYAADGGGWYAKNLRTRRTIRIKSAARLRYECDREGNRLGSGDGPQGLKELLRF